jgi:4-amino-4-deoxy-L-arabinose transferase-like glycosyltransferase
VASVQAADHGASNDETPSPGSSGHAGAAAEPPAAAPAEAEPRRSAEPSSARLIALFVAALMLLPLLGTSGIWDPYELDSADLARRIAVSAFGAQRLQLPDAVSSMPTLSDLRMGELGFTSMALGFKLFGLRDWAGRLPLALWGLAGAMVLYEILARLVDRRAGLYAVIALVTMPLYVIQARTMLGDVVTMAALAMAWGGLTGALLDRGAARAAWIGVGLAGLCAGYLSRGLLIGVAVPALGVGCGWLLLRVGGGGVAALGAPARGRVRPGDLVGAAVLVVGLAAAVQGLSVLQRAAFGAPLLRDLGVALLKKPPVESTFDLTVRQLGHALFPWSAFLPFAIGRLFRAPDAEAGSAGAEGAAIEREAAVRVAVLVTAAFAFGAFALLAPRTGALPFSGPAILAAIAALAIHDFERGAPPSRALSLGCVLLAFVLYRDFALQPEKALSVFSVDKPVFPKSFEHESALILRIVFVAFAAIVGLTWIEAQRRASDPGLDAWARRRADEYLHGAAELARVWGGNLAFVGVVVEAALVGLGAMIFVGRRVGWAAVSRMPKNVADYGVNAWWALPLGLALAPIVFVALRDGFGLLVARARLPRAAGTVAAGLIAGAALGFWYYPALAAQLSPKEVFESYLRLRKEGEPLAVLGVSSRAATYYQGGEVQSLPDVGRAFMWLEAERGAPIPPPPSERRWLIVRADDLPKLNSLYRKKAGRNVPVLDGRSSQILLVSNDLGGRENESWLGRMVLDAPPSMAHPLEATLEDQLDALGWEVTDARGRVVDSVVPQRPYRLRTYFRVRRTIGSSWKMFIHIDGFQRRYNGDHPVLDGRYPMNLWQPGDIIVDDHEFQLEPNFTPGDYTLYFGFFSGDTRFRVTSGPHQENRIIAGPLRVR